MSIIKLFREGKLHDAKELVLKSISEEKEKLTEELKKYIQSDILDEARYKIVRVRIRKGKIQRRKKVATVKGYTLRGGKITRMSQAERRNRRIGQRRGKVKRQAKMARAIVKRKRSLRRLGNLGGGPKRKPK